MRTSPAARNVVLISATWWPIAIASPLLSPVAFPVVFPLMSPDDRAEACGSGLRVSYRPSHPRRVIAVWRTLRRAAYKSSIFRRRRGFGRLPRSPSSGHGFAPPPGASSGEGAS